MPIGFDDDTAYLSPLDRWLAQRVLAAPPGIVRETSIERFRYRTLLALLGAADLALISIWSPTFLLALLEALPDWADRLVAHLHDGHEPGRSASSSPPIPPDRARARALERIFTQHGPGPAAWPHLWPHLAVISCWTDASARPHFQRLQALWPSARFQGKGLLATEACVSLPLVGHEGCALALTSHFFEFLEPGRAETLLAHELRLGGRYNVLVTTGGGLYRYPLGDEVEVVGYLHECPLLRFIGRGDDASDLVGEKLSEAFVADALAQAQAATSLQATFVMLSPGDVDELPHYDVALETQANATQIAAFMERLEGELRGNPHYAYARDLGQLGGLDVIHSADPPGSAWQRYEQACVARGMRLGDIKPRALASLGFRPSAATLRHSSL
jgi:hypothetical protein